MKYILQEDTDDATARVTICETEQQRDEATLRAIFGEGPLDDDKKQEAESYLRDLREDGFVVFEGDPAIRWVDAHELIFTKGAIDIGAKAIEDLDRLTPRPLTAEDQARAVISALANDQGDGRRDGGPTSPAS